MYSFGMWVTDNQWVGITVRSFPARIAFRKDVESLFGWWLVKPEEGRMIIDQELVVVICLNVQKYPSTFVILPHI